MKCTETSEEQPMPYAINEHHVAGVLALPAAERYGHFIRRVADWQELWGLKSGGWITCGDDNGAKCLPFWPHPEYANLMATSEWDTAIPERIELPHFMEWLPKIESDGYLVAVFPIPSGRGVIVKPSELLQHLSAECGQYE